MNKVSGLVLIAPHSCGQITDNYCDSTTKEVAQMLSVTSYPELVDVYATGFESGTPNVDMDKYEARNTNFRRDLTKKALEFKQKYGDNVLAINIHSFHPSERPEWKDSEVVIIDGRTINDDLETVGLAYFLNNNKVMTKVVYNGDVDIHNEMNDLGIKNITLEFNQELSNERLEEIVNLINKWVHSPAGSVETKGIRGGHGGSGRNWGGGGGNWGGSRGFGGGGGAAFGLGAGLLTGVALGSVLSSGYGYGGYGAYPYGGYPAYPAYGYGNYPAYGAAYPPVYGYAPTYYPY